VAGPATSWRSSSAASTRLSAPRIWDLNGGNPRLQTLIVDSGARRPTRRNRKAIVWVAKRIPSDLFMSRVEVKQDTPWTRERVLAYVRAKRSR
jgi:hypothetical protein